MYPAEILIVDDEADIRDLIAGILEDEGYHPRLAANAEEALQEMENRQPALVVLDVWLKASGMDGLQILDEIKRNHPDTPVIMISGHATIDIAVQATKAGAYDFIVKPFKSARLLLAITHALSAAKLNLDNRELSALAGYSKPELIGTSPASEALGKRIAFMAQHDQPVFVQGPAGSGKSVVARLIHDQSIRQKAPFVRVNCGHIDAALVDSTLFGVEANIQRPRHVGLIEQAHGGTLFLDGISELSLSGQKSLLRFIHQGFFQRVGGTAKITVNVRLIASTSLESGQLAASDDQPDLLLPSLQKFFSAQLVSVPAFDDRRDDMAALAQYFIARACAMRGRVVPRLSGGAITLVQDHDWPGNAWELQSVIEQALLASDPGQKVLTADQLESAMRHKTAAIAPADQGEAPVEDREEDKLENFFDQPLKKAREDFEKAYLAHHLERCQHNVQRTAREIGMDRASLHRKLKSLGLMSSDGSAEEDV